jgi:hypothetical protein
MAARLPRWSFRLENYLRIRPFRDFQVLKRSFEGAWKRESA